MAPAPENKAKFQKNKQFAALYFFVLQMKDNIDIMYFNLFKKIL